MGVRGKGVEDRGRRDGTFFPAMQSSSVVSRRHNGMFCFIVFYGQPGDSKVIMDETLQTRAALNYN